MSLLLETIRFVNGRFDNLPLHQLRMDQSRKELFGRNIAPLNLNEILTGFSEITKFEKDTVYKCRVVYGKDVREIELQPYSFPRIGSLKLVNDDTLDYHLKYFDRSALNNLLLRKGACDDILIVKNGLITDTSFSNILFYNGKKWITPAFPLLKGTRRMQLLKDETVEEAEIRPGDLRFFSVARLINAMIRFEDTVAVDVRNIFH